MGGRIMGKFINIGSNIFNEKKISAGQRNGYLTYLQGDRNSYILVDGWCGYRANAGDVAGTIPLDIPKIEVGIVGVPTMAGVNMIVGMPNDGNTQMRPLIYTIGPDMKVRAQGKGAQFENGVTITDANNNMLHTVIYGGDVSYIDNQIASDNSNMANQYRLSAYNGRDLCIFGGLYNDEFILSSARIQFVKLYNGETLVHDFRAYIKDGVPCMLDEVDSTYHYNEGEGKFRYGDIIPE